MDDKYDLKKHVNFRYTEDGGASPYDLSLIHISVLQKLAVLVLQA